ncbi:recombinase family protein [Roseiconus lacunae]|uniref:recombinase family protein n=1 Tax=Roseiconus lacunae TaxID=2605694 RepID=UPI001E3DF7F7|nr:recombinase family protein [Roseiconus lacunae]MCD0462484.1 recombinase family protein [Roseiconus lacunae]
MHHQISEDGGVSAELARNALDHWMTAAAAGINLDGLDPTASHEDLVKWARSRGLDIGSIYSRFSTKMQQSTEDQIRENLYWAARNNIFVPPRFISVDEGAKGSRVRRVGLERTKKILESGEVKVLLIYKASRLFRQAGKGFQFVQEEVVEAGLRAVSTSQGIDTQDRKTWKLQLQMHGMMDEMLLDAIADHVRDGQRGHFMNGHVTGAVGVGFCRKEVPGGRPTNRGLPRTEIAVDEEVAPLIRKHFEWILNGMSIREGVRRWNAEGGPCDPRSTTGKMTYNAYRRMLSNARMTGRFEFGRRRNQFSTKRDYVQQIEQPDQEVMTRHEESLRIVDDETFYAVQELLAKRKTGPRGPRGEKHAKLCDLVTGTFYCTHCSTSDAPVRFYMAGANGRGMRCSNGDNCPHPSCVRRDEAVEAVCQELAELIIRDADLVADFICRSQELDSDGEETLRTEIAAGEKKLRSLKSRIDGLYEFIAEGTADEKRETQSRLRVSIAERASVQASANRLRKSMEQAKLQLSEADVRAQLADMASMLNSAASGELGDDAVYEALSVFKLLTGERIWVTVQPRAGRKQTNVRGRFRPRLIDAATARAGATVIHSEPGEPISFWLRKPPRLDAIAERVHELIDQDGMSYREAAKRLREEGHNVNSGNVWYSYRRWYEMNNLPMPDVPYNNGNKRDSA